jgi:hypothetical protein
MPNATADRPLRHAVLLAIVLAIPLLFSLRLTVVDDPDIWWHLRTGQWILEHHTLPSTEPFSTFGADKPWVAYSWLFDLVAYGFYRAFGLFGILLLQASLALSTAVALYALARRFTTSLAGPALTAAALLAMVPMYAPRPWLLTVLFFIWEIHLLFASLADGNSRRLLWLVPLFALWANIHIQFVYGLLVLGLALATPFLSAVTTRLVRASAQTVSPDARLHPTVSTIFLWSLFAVCIAATLLTPYGWHIYRVVYEYASQPAVFNLVTEFHAPAFRSIPDFIVLLMTMAAVAALARAHVNLGTTLQGISQHAFSFQFLLLAVTAMLSFRSARDTWCVVLVAIAVLAQAAGRSARQAFVVGRRETALATVMLGLLASLTIGARQLTNASLQRRLAAVYPVQAVREIQARRYSGPLYNHFNWGGYLIWSLPELRVAMDGRTNVHGDARIARSVSTWNGDPGWQHDPELAAAGLIVAAPGDPLFLNLREDRRFRLVYQDRVAGLFIAAQ